jgi:hypothetical protein
MANRRNDPDYFDYYGDYIMGHAHATFIDDPGERPKKKRDFPFGFAVSEKEERQYGKARRRSKVRTRKRG